MQQDRLENPSSPSYRHRAAVTLPELTSSLEISKGRTQGPCSREQRQQGIGSIPALRHHSQH